MKKMNHNFLLMDAEYGGIKSNGKLCHDYSILEIYLEVTDENLDYIDSLELKIKPDNDQYIVSAEGLAANKIDLIKHNQVAITQGKAKELLYNFLKKNSKDGEVKLFPLGKGIVGDIRYLFDQKFIAEHNWRAFCSDQIVDFGSVIMLLKILGLYPQTRKNSDGKMSNSLEALADHLNIKTSNLHEARGDVELYKLVCKDLFKKLKKHLPMVPLTPFKKDDEIL